MAEERNQPATQWRCQVILRAPRQTQPCSLSTVNIPTPASMPWWFQIRMVPSAVFLRLCRCYISVYLHVLLIHWVIMLVLKPPRFGVIGIFSTAVILQLRPMSMALPLIRSMFMMEIGVQWWVPMAIAIMVSGGRFHVPPALIGRRVAGLTYRVLMILPEAIPVGSDLV